MNDDRQVGLVVRGYGNLRQLLVESFMETWEIDNDDVATGASDDADDVSK